MEKLKKVDFEKCLTKALKNLIKDKEKSEKFCGVNVREWYSGGEKWARTEVRIYHEWYAIEDEILSERAICTIVEKVSKKLSTNKVVLVPQISKGIIVKGISILTPCKEFNKLQKYLKEKANLIIEPKDMYYVSVCGKRSSWSESMRKYIANQEKSCQGILKQLKDVVGRNRLTAQVVRSNVEYENEEDYRIAQYQESEWYGYIITRLMIKVTTPSNKVKEIPYMGEWFMAWK